ncbi:MAG TPA: glycosyltransferase [Micromonosporaceae bacterium]|nr:glycosyltransferase [Micromonosporaceae bacterium]
MSTEQRSPGGDGSAPRHVTAIATAFHPQPEVLRVLEAAGSACAAVLVVDNTPGGADLLRGQLPDRVRVLRPGHNLGLAGALNLGLRELSSQTDAVLLLDQDSVLVDDAVHRLTAHLADPTIGAVGPAPWDEAHGSFIDPRTTFRREVADRDAIIASGMVVRRALLDQLGGFREDFFVDCVDLDFCLRLRRTGSRIVQDRRVRLPHTLGNTRAHRFLTGSVRVTHHPTWRLYWVARNSVLLVRENFRFTPAWCMIWMMIIFRWVLLTALYERPRRPRLDAMWSGVRDGIRGRTDRRFLPAPDARRFRRRGTHGPD